MSAQVWVIGVGNVISPAAVVVPLVVAVVCVLALIAMELWP